MESKFAISHYHDVEEIYKKIDKLLAQPIRPIKRDKMSDYLDYFETKCRQSKQMNLDAKKFIPGGVQHNLAFNYPFPLAISSSQDAHLFDIDNNRYIDFLQAGGPTVLGSNYPLVKEKVKHLLDECGPVTGLFHEFELKIAEFICNRYQGVDKFRMLGSGTEGVMAAMRLARVATGKKKIIKIGGAYHGWSDQVVYGIRIPKTGSFEAHGIPKECLKHTQEVPPNNIKALEKLLKQNRFRGGTAAIIVEPIGPESGTRPVEFDYNQKIRDLCNKCGTLLIFDEVVSAFRIGITGAQGYYNVTPDLTVFGKAVAGGYPSAGGLGGKDKYMKFLSAGLGGANKKVMIGGTLAANPLSAAAGYYTLLEIEKQNACEKAGKAGDRLTKGLQSLIEKYKLPYIAYNQGSVCHLETAGTMFVKLNLAKFWSIPAALKEIQTRKHMMEEMGAAFMAEGIVTLAGSRMYTSMADSNEIIDDALLRFEKVFQNIEGVD
jgi:glutamate-1-semialdehyde 2,1-aminomutase